MARVYIFTGRSSDLAAGLCSHAFRSALQTKRQPTLWALLRHLRRQLWGSKLPGGGLVQPLQNLQNHPVKAGNTQAQSFTGLLYTSQNLHTNHPVKAGNLQAHPSTGLVNIPFQPTSTQSPGLLRKPLCLSVFLKGAGPALFNWNPRSDSQDYSWFNHASEDSLSKIWKK